MNAWTSMLFFDSTTMLKIFIWCSEDNRHIFLLMNVHGSFWGYFVSWSVTCLKKLQKAVYRMWMWLLNHNIHSEMLGGGFLLLMDIFWVWLSRPQTYEPRQCQDKYTYSIHYTTLHSRVGAGRCSTSFEPVLVNLFKYAFYTPSNTF